MAAPSIRAFNTRQPVPLTLLLAMAAPPAGVLHPQPQRGYHMRQPSVSLQADVAAEGKASHKTPRSVVEAAACPPSCSNPWLRRRMSALVCRHHQPCTNTPRAQLRPAVPASRRRRFQATWCSSKQVTRADAQAVHSHELPTDACQSSKAEAHPRRCEPRRWPALRGAASPSLSAAGERSCRDAALHLMGSGRPPGLHKA